MTFPKARLVVSAILFLSWLGYLFFLVLETKAVVISRPQFQIAQTVLVVEVRDDGGTPDPMVTVKEVLWGDGAHAGEKLRLTDLLACKKEHGYSGAGDYVIPLMRRGGVWQIAQVPTPGYKRPHPSHGSLELRDAGPNPDCVLESLLEYAKQKPGEADDLLRPLLPALAMRNLGPAFFGDDLGRVVYGDDFRWQRWIEVPLGTLPRRLPIEDATALVERLKKCGAEVRVDAEEVRIYRCTPDVRGQVLKCKP